MNFFIEAFNVILYEPLFNALIFLYQVIPDFGIAVIVLTLLIRLLLYPSTAKSIKSQQAMSEIQPKVKEIQEKYDDNKEEQAQEMMKLYQEKGVNPFSGCLPLLIQLPILIGLFRVFYRGFKAEQMTHLYSFVSNPGVIDQTFLGIIDLSQSSPVMAILAGVFQFLQTKTSTASTPQSGDGSGFGAMFKKQMIYLFPVLTVFIVWRLPAAIGLYWITTTMFMVGQQYYLKNKKTDNSKQKTDDSEEAKQDEEK